MEVESPALGAWSHTIGSGFDLPLVPTMATREQSEMQPFRIDAESRLLPRRANGTMAGSVPALALPPTAHSRFLDARTRSWL